MYHGADRICLLISYIRGEESIAMKIRIKGNSLRLRLNQNRKSLILKPMDLFLEETHVLGGVFNYRLSRECSKLRVLEAYLVWFRF